jgi:hypothetical protein
MKVLLAWLCVLGASTVVLAACGKQDGELPSGVAVKVGDTSILESAVEHRLNAVYASRKGSVRSWGPPRYQACITAMRKLRRISEAKILKEQCKTEFTIERGLAAQFLIQAQWVDNEARRRGIELNREIKQLTDEQTKEPLGKAFRKPLNRASNDRRALVVDIGSRRLRDAMPITKSEIVGYANANAETFLESERRTVNILQVRTKAKAARARRDLKTLTWRQVQGKYGTDPLLTWTGKHTVRKLAAPHDAFGRSMFAVQRGKIVGPIRTLSGWFILQVMRIRSPSGPRLSLQARHAISNILRSERLDKVLRKHYLRQTKCATKYAIPQVPECG